MLDNRSGTVSSSTLPVKLNICLPPCANSKFQIKVTPILLPNIVSFPLIFLYEKKSDSYIHRN